MRWTAVVLALALAGCGGDADAPPPEGAVANGDIVFTSKRDGDWDVYRARADGSRVRNLTRNHATAGSEADDDRPAWSPDGTMIAFTSTRDHRGDGDESRDVYVMAADGTRVRRLTDNHAAEREVDWTPDGRIVFWRCTGGVFGCRVAAIAPDRTGEKTLFAAGTGVVSLSVSPDGEQIAFTRWDVSSTAGGDVVVARLDGSDERRLTNSRGADGDPVWSPDGTRIAFVSDRDRNGRCEFHDCAGFAPELYVMDADGSHERRLTHDADYDVAPTWSPDGRLIAFARLDDGTDYDVYVVDADGGEPRPLVATGDWELPADWRATRTTR